MLLSEVEVVLANPLDIIDKRFPCVKVYFFGSIIKSVGLCGDVDILVVYEKMEHVKALTELFAEASYRLPLHLIWMTVSEEKELGFIEQQQAVDFRSPILNHRMPSTRHDRSSL